MNSVTPADFDYIRRLTAAHSGLALPPGKEYLVESRLQSIVVREHMGSLSDLVARMASGASRLQRDVVEAMATHETYFFRDVHPFDALRAEIIPDVLASNGSHELAVWSAAASTGQEAFSLAMLMKEDFPRVPNMSILATDFSLAALERAKLGRFSQLEVNRGLPAKLLVKYFERDGRDWQVKASIRDMVTFRELNLIQPFPALPKMDIVLLRNVLTYFDSETKSKVLGRIGPVLKPGGYLILGGAETTYGLDSDFEIVRVGKSVCYKFKGA